MSGWKKVRLDQCSRIVGGSTPKTSTKEYWDGNIYWATPKDLSHLDSKHLDSTPRTITREGLNSCGAEILPVNSVLFSSRAPIGHVAINRVPMATNQGFKSFVPDTEKLDPQFLYYWLCDNRAYFNNLGNGATFKEVSKAIVSQVEISLPPICTQKRIAAILDQGEALRSLRRQSIGQLDALSRSVFLEMFGDPVTNPKYPVNCIRPFAEASSGKSSKIVLSPVPTETPIYGGNGINGWATQSLYDEPILIFGRVGQQCGNTYLTTQPVWVTDNAIAVKVIQKTVVRLDYLLHAFNMTNFSDRVKYLDLPFINQQMILDFPISIPPLALQQEFADRIGAIEALKSQHRESLAKMDSLFASLQHRAFRGEL